ncbi:MAG: hypothetical protein WCP12_18235 [bacterium]
MKLNIERPTSNIERSTSAFAKEAATADCYCRLLLLFRVASNDADASQDVCDLVTAE